MAMPRYSVELTRELRQRLKVAATREGKTMTEVVIRLIEEYVEKSEAKQGKPTRKGEKKFPGQWDVAVQKKGAERPSKK